VTRASIEESLPPRDVLLLDTTVIASYFKGTEAASPVATHVVDRLVAAGRNPAVISTITAMELLVPPIRDEDDALYRHVLFFLLNTPGITVIDTDMVVAREAAAIRAAFRLKPPDALIIGAGRVHHASHFVTNDKEWKRKLPASAPVEMAVCYLEDHLPFP
jgi:predicted nucleic acid-binding protein